MFPIIANYAPNMSLKFSSAPLIVPNSTLCHPMSFLQNFIHVTTNKLTSIAKPKGKATSSSGVACGVRSTINWLPNLFFSQNQFL